MERNEVRELSEKYGFPGGGVCAMDKNSIIEAKVCWAHPTELNCLCVKATIMWSFASK